MKLIISDLIRSLRNWYVREIANPRIITYIKNVKAGETDPLMFVPKTRGLRAKLKDAIGERGVYPLNPATVQYLRPILHKCITMQRWPSRKELRKLITVLEYAHTNGVSNVALFVPSWLVPEFPAFMVFRYKDVMDRRDPPKVAVMNAQTLCQGVRFKWEATPYTFMVSNPAVVEQCLGRFHRLRVVNKD